VDYNEKAYFIVSHRRHFPRVIFIEKGIKLLVLDLDGTLLNKKGFISEEDKQALSRVADSGIRVSLSSGRSVSSCLPIINQLGLNGFHTTFDGALISDPKSRHEVFADPIPFDLVDQIIGYTHDTGINIELYSDNRLFIEQDSWTANVRRQVFHAQPVITDFTLIRREERIIKGTVVARSPQEKARAAAFAKYFRDTLCFSTNRTPSLPDVDFVNVLAPGVSKGKAVGVLTSYLDISLEEVMAVGDGLNDISLLSKVGIGVAMADASEELKSVARHVTLDAEHSGVADAVNRILFAE
jgi:Cof subfamily protein (haloacid dehalogenase superfamily)